MTYLLEALGHEVWHLRDLAEPEALDADVLRLAHDRGCILRTCNRDDFLLLAGQQSHQGIIIVIRRRTRAAERAALFRLLDVAGEAGLAGNINFA